MSAPSTLSRALALVLVLAASGASATGSLAQKTLTAADKARIAAFDPTRADAILEAKTGGDPADVATLTKILAGAPQPILGTDIRGTYRCRTVKLGGQPPLTIYDWFACRIDEDDLGYRIVKTSGSQRFSGHFIDESRTRLLYYGASHYLDEKPKAYGADPERNQIGYLVKVGAGRYRLELPAPIFESNFDIIELVAR
jgi:hypothetical protein